MLKVPVLRAEVAREYEEYQVAVDEYNRQRMQEMRQPVPGAPVCMAYAHAAPRCAHVRADGTRCAAPALRERTICYAHTRMLMSRKPGLKLPVLEDAGGIALAAMQVVQQMLDGKLPRRKAATALYGIQIVATTLNHRPFAVQPTSVVMEAEGLPPEEELMEAEGKHPALSGQQSAEGGDCASESRSSGSGAEAIEAVAVEEGRSQGTAREAGEEARVEVPLEDRDPSLRSGLLNKEGSDPALGSGSVSSGLASEARSGPVGEQLSGFEGQQSPLGKEWWDEWEKKVRAIASGAESNKRPQGVKDGDVREGVG